MEERIKVLNETKYKKLTSNMKITEREQFFDGYVMYTYIEAKKDNETFWFIKLQSPIKTIYLMVQESHIKMLNEIRQRNIEDFAMTLYPFFREV